MTTRQLLKKYSGPIGLADGRTEARKHQLVRRGFYLELRNEGVDVTPDDPPFMHRQYECGDQLAWLCVPFPSVVYRAWWNVRDLFAGLTKRYLVDDRQRHQS